jgi:hypothetical protein
MLKERISKGLLFDCNFCAGQRQRPSRKGRNFSRKTGVLTVIAVEAE